MELILKGSYTIPATRSGSGSSFTCAVGLCWTTVNGREMWKQLNWQKLLEASDSSSSDSSTTCGHMHVKHPDNAFGISFCVAQMCKTVSAHAQRILASSSSSSVGSTGFFDLHKAKDNDIFICSSQKISISNFSHCVSCNYPQCSSIIPLRLARCHASIHVSKLLYSSSTPLNCVPSIKTTDYATQANCAASRLGA